MSFLAYIICATPRSGSTLLCDMLRASGVAGHPHSYFRGQDIGYWAGSWGIGGSTDFTDPEFNQTYLSVMRRVGTGDTGIFGLRLMWNSMDETRERLNSAFGGHADVACQLEQAFGPILYIYLSRLDKVAQAVSFVRAEQTGLWHVAADGTERERTAPASAPVFDAQSIVRSRDDLVSDDRSWSYFFDQHAIEPMRLTYERLAADPRSALAEILVALGRNPTSALGVCAATAKMADGLNEEWAQRIMHA